MVNQNPEPRIYPISAEINAQEKIEEVNLPHKMGSPEVMMIYSVYCYIFPGYYAIGSDDDYDERWTWTDIDPLYIPVLNNPYRENDIDDTSPFVVTLPVCCDPRPWTDIDLTLTVGSNQIPTRPIDLSIIAESPDKNFVFTSPLKIDYNRKLYYTLFNNNPVVAAADTFTKLKIMLNGEVVNAEAMKRRYEAVEKLRKTQSVQTPTITNP